MPVNKAMTPPAASVKPTVWPASVMARPSTAKMPPPDHAADADGDHFVKIELFFGVAGQQARVSSSGVSPSYALRCRNQKEAHRGRFGAIGNANTRVPHVSILRRGNHKCRTTPRL